MSTDANVALVHQVVEEVFNQGHVATADEVFVPPIGAAIKHTATTLRAAFPDLHFTIEDTLAVGDKVVICATVRCTHSGAPFAGAPANGKQATWTGIDISQIADDKIVNLWAEYDYLSLLQQLGIVPTFDAGSA